MGHADASLTRFHWEFQPAAQAIVNEVAGPARVLRRLDRKLLAPIGAAKFVKHGATVSHPGNLERNGGFKRFNQQGVSDIISRTDPRKALASSDA